MAMTVGRLKSEISTIPDDAEIYGYVGADGIHIQAEGHVDNDLNRCTILRVPAAAPTGGGPAE